LEVERGQMIAKIKKKKNFFQEKKKIFFEKKKIMNHLLIVSSNGYSLISLEKHNNESEQNFMARVYDLTNSYIPSFEQLIYSCSYIVCGEKMAYISLDCEQNDIGALLLHQLSGFVGVVNGKIAIFFNQRGHEAYKRAMMLIRLYNIQHLKLFSRIAKVQ
jgi:hypothetical protein